MVLVNLGDAVSTGAGFGGLAGAVAGISGSIGIGVTVSDKLNQVLGVESTIAKIASTVGYSCAAALPTVPGGIVLGVTVGAITFGIYGLIEEKFF